MNKSQGRAAMLALLDQAKASVEQFVKNNGVENLLPLVERYIAESRGDDPKRAMDSILASYGLLVAFVDLDVMAAG